MILIKMAEEVEETYIDPVTKYSTIGNLENAKRAFFNNDYDGFIKEINEKPYKFFVCNYKYSSDFDGRPDFIARNLNRGFVKDLEDNKKYFMSVFRCVKKEEKVYDYKSLWIVNTNDEISSILGSRYEDFSWTEITDDINKNTFFCDFKKQEENDNIVSEDYLH
jgi:hypothetical protein